MAQRSSSYEVSYKYRGRCMWYTRTYQHGGVVALTIQSELAKTGSLMING